MPEINQALANLNKCAINHIFKMIQLLDWGISKNYLFATIVVLNCDFNSSYSEEKTTVATIISVASRNKRLMFFI